jgi:hypothetical protein
MKSFAMEFQMPGPLIFTHRANHSSYSCFNLMLLCLILIYICKVNHWFLLNVSNRKLEDGDIVNIDVTVYYKGVHGKFSGA